MLVAPKVQVRFGLVCNVAWEGGDRPGPGRIFKDFKGVTVSPRQRQIQTEAGGCQGGDRGGLCWNAGLQRGEAPALPAAGGEQAACRWVAKHWAGHSKPRAHWVTKRGTAPKIAPWHRLAGQSTPMSHCTAQLPPRA